MANTPEDIINRMKRGINFGNGLNALVEGNWRPPATETYFKEVANVGFKHVRLPLRFDNYTTPFSEVVYEDGNLNYIGSPSQYTVESTWLDRVEQVVGWAQKYGLIIILDMASDNWFWESYDIDSPEYKTGNDRLAAIDRFKAIWLAVSNRFINHDYEVLFELMNEPYFHMSATEVDTINLMLIDLVRGTGGNNVDRNIIITGGGVNSWEAPLQISDTVINHDDYLIATFHMYQPRKFTHSADGTITDRVFTWGTEEDIADLKLKIETVKAWSVQKNIPVLLGEYGADNENGYVYETETYRGDGGPVNESRVKYYGTVTNFARNAGFATSAWCGGHSSYKTIYIDKNNSWVVDVRNAILNINGLSYKKVTLPLLNSYL